MPLQRTRPTSALDLTTGKRRLVLPRIRRPNTSIHRRNTARLKFVEEALPEVFQNEAYSFSCTSDDDDDESVEYITAYDDVEFYKSKKRRFSSAVSLSNLTIATEFGEENLFSEDETTDDETEMKDDDTDKKKCHFGEVSWSMKRLSDFDNHPCPCLSRVQTTEDTFGEWTTSCIHNNTQQPKKGSRQQQKTYMFYHQVPGFIKRIQESLAKPKDYTFFHYENPSRYIQQYREKYSSIGRMKMEAKGVAKRQPFIPVPIADPYVPKLRSNAYSVADNFDFFAILALEKEGDQNSDEVVKDDEDDVKNDQQPMSVQDRGKDLNLAPVRDIQKPQIQTTEVKISKKSYVAVNQYLNLVIPKTNLHKKTLRLNLDPPRDNWTPRYESQRKPNARRSESVVSQKISSESKLSETSRRASSESSNRLPPDSSRRVSSERPRVSSAGNRASELRLSRSKTTNYGTPIPKETSYKTVSPSPIIPQSPSSLTRSKTQNQKAKCVNRIHAMLSDIDDCKGKVEKERRSFDDSKTNSSAKHGRVIPATKPLGVEGQNCRHDDQLTIIYRIQKEKERAMRVPVK